MSCCYPPYSNVDPNWSYSGLTPALGNSLYYETININLPIGVLQVVIPYSLPKVTSSAIPVAAVYNFVDDPQLIIHFNVAARSLNSMTLLLSAAPDSPNYFLKGYIQVI